MTDAECRRYLQMEIDFAVLQDICNASVTANDKSKEARKFRARAAKFRKMTFAEFEKECGHWYE